MAFCFHRCSEMNIDCLVFAYWCARRTDLSWDDYNNFLRDLKTAGSLDSFDLVERWRLSLPWLDARIHLDSKRDRQVLHGWINSGIDILTPLCKRFPKALRLIENPPRILFGQGNWDCLGGDCLAVVGSREPSSLSLNWLEEELGYFLEKNPVTVVSGGARGIDMAAHRTALRKNVPTVVLFPSGLQQMYPESWRREQIWRQEVLKNEGLLLSEYAPPISIQKKHFLERNRLISGLSKAALLIEARCRSGTLVTARAALEQGKPLYILPAHPYDTNARGGLDLIADGALLIRDAEDLSLFFRSELRF